MESQVVRGSQGLMASVPSAGVRRDGRGYVGGDDVRVE